MSKQLQRAQEPQLTITKEQVIAVSGTLLASGLVDLAAHSVPLAIAGVCATIAAGRFTPDIMRVFFPHSDAEKTEQVVNEIIEQISPDASNDLPQDFKSKMRRLFNRPEPEQLSQPKDERPQIGATRPGPSKSSTANIKVPGTFTLDAHIEAIRELNRQGYIYLGIGSVDKTCKLSLATMYHVFDVSNSGSGKSNRFRLAMMQLVEYCEVYYINPFANRLKFLPESDSRKVEVWTPIYDRLANGKPVKEADETLALLRALIDERQARNVLESHDDFSWSDKPIFLFVDELPEVFRQCKEASDLLDKIVCTGRQYNIFAWVASQSGAVQDIGQSEATQAQYKTRIYGGGDSRSATKLMKGHVSTEDENTLHKYKKGLTLMLAEDLSDRQFVRNPLVTNEALFAYFGLPFNLDDWYKPLRPGSSPYRSSVADRMNKKPTPMPLAQNTPVQPQPLDTAAQLERITKLYEQDKIDFDMFVRLLANLDITERDVSRAGNSRDTEEPNLSSQSTNLRLVSRSQGNIPEAAKDSVSARLEPFPTLPDLSPRLGKEDYKFTPEQEADFLRRYAKRPNVGDCLEHMPNSKGGIGLSNHYYRYANWLAKQQQREQ